jgi:hypothetical protein
MAKAGAHPMLRRQVSCLLHLILVRFHCSGIHFRSLVLHWCSLTLRWYSLVFVDASLVFAGASPVFIFGVMENHGRASICQRWARLTAIREYNKNKLLASRLEGSKGRG